jgi:hypothetical protein
MRRAAIFLVIGIAIGAAGALHYGNPARDPGPGGEPAATPSTPAARQAPETSGRAALAALAGRPAGTAERAAVYALAARASSREIDALLDAAAALGDATARTFAVDVLVTRYAELDSARALTAARAAGLPPFRLASIYHVWLRTDATDALAALGGLTEAEAHGVGSALLTLVGDDELTVSRILAAVPQTVADALAPASLGHAAEEDPARALARAREIADPAVRDNALRLVIAAWAERDPDAALAQADATGDPALQSYARSIVLGRLTQRDPAATLRYLAALDAGAQLEMFRLGVWQQAATAQPELALELAGGFPLEFRAALEQVALQGLAQRDPQAAIARLAQLPPGLPRQELVRAVGRSYAERDPEAALAWARALQPREPGALGAVIGAIGAQDPLRALDLAIEIAEPLEQMQALQSAVMSTAFGDPAMTPRLLERVLTLPSGAQRQPALQMLLSQWASRSPVDAADWLVANVDRAPAQVMTDVAAQLARLDAGRAASYAQRMPSGARGAWLRGVANTYAAADPLGALAWIEQYRGTPEYDDTAVAIVAYAAQHDPAAAARVVDSIGRPELRGAATGSVASVWAIRDPAAARQWALGQRPGAERDQAVMTLITSAARLGSPDASLFAALSSEQARLAAVQMASFTIAQRSPEEARQLIETHVAEDVHRQRLLSMLAQRPTQRMGITGSFVPGQMAVFPPIVDAVTIRDPRTGAPLQLAPREAAGSAPRGAGAAASRG